MQASQTQLPFDAVYEYGLANDGRQGQDTPKANWNLLHTTFRPRSGRQLSQLQQQLLSQSEFCCFGGVSGGGGGGGGGPSVQAAAAARPSSAATSVGFPARFQRSAKPRKAADAATAAEAAAADAAAAAAAEAAELADMWRLDGEEDGDAAAVELEAIFDQLAGRGEAELLERQRLKQQHQRQQQKQQQQQQQQQQRRQLPTGRRIRSGRKSANQLYQEHLLAEVAKHRQRASHSGEQQPLPARMSLFIPKTRTRLCRLFTGPCLLRGVGAGGGGRGEGGVSGGSFLPIARSLMPLPAELRPLSRQGWSLATGGGGSGGIVQVSGDSCQCVGRLGSGVGGHRHPQRRPDTAASRHGGGVSSECCAICQRMKQLQLA